MNEPYQLTDVIGEITENTRQALQLSILNYQFGTLDELVETLKQMSETVKFETKKYPLLWFVLPFTIVRKINNNLGFGETLIRIFIFTDSDVNLKANERIEIKFKKILNPIYYSFLDQLNMHPAISYEANGQAHDITYRFKIEELVDLCDCIDINNLLVRINNNTNC